MKNKRILSIFFLVVVITTFFVPMFSLSAFAEDEVVQDEQNIVSGDPFLFSSPLNDTYYPGLDEVPKIKVYCEFELIGLNSHYIGFEFSKRSGDGIVTLGYIRDDGSVLFVYNRPLGRDGFEFEYYRYIRFLSDVTDSQLNLWLLSNGEIIDKVDSIFYDIGFSAGSDVGYSHGFSDGFSDGKAEGILIGENSGFGQNLLGDTLTAPVKALDSFVLYQSSSGFKITLWGVFSTVLAVGLTIWFIKMFAGG